jgi:hypothetical protein
MDLLLNCFAFGAINATAMNDRVVKLGYDEYYKLITTTTTTERKSDSDTTTIRNYKMELNKKHKSCNLKLPCSKVRLRF